jgi:hypothetical protein
MERNGGIKSFKAVKTRQKKMDINVEREGGGGRGC